MTPRMATSNLTKHLRTATCTLALALTVAACDSDVQPRGTTPTGTDGGTTPPTSGGPIVVGSGGSSVDNGQYRIELSATNFDITEGGNIAGLDVTVVRQNGHSEPINFALRGNTSADENNMRWVFDDNQLTGTETTTTAQIELGVGRAPILPQSRQLVLVATDGSSAPLEATLNLSITPTSADDVYLLVGQSNMVGASLPARASGPGEPDEPNSRIRQLNVTGNDTTNFPSPSAFTNPDNVANPDARTVTALDPLHDGFNFAINGKTSERVGLGLSFAKAMLPNTSANIYLVPAAWSDSGFCKTETVPFDAGWNTVPPADTTNFGSTLLHDRAITRLNLALQETGGVFRGILWHQGEGDSNSAVCANAYQQNLSALVASIRSNAQVDARGNTARGAAADIPFVAGTMSFGEEFAQVSSSKQIVDGVHRTVGSFIPFAATSIHDDLVPPAYPCGEGSCVHFGATAYREMGRRYADRMLEIQRR